MVTKMLHAATGHYYKYLGDVNGEPMFGCGCDTKWCPSKGALRARDHGTAYSSYQHA